MNIVIINLHSAFNEGDRLLAESTIGVLQQTFPDARFTLVANDPVSFECFVKEGVTVIPSLTCWFKHTYEAHSRWIPSRLLISPLLLKGSEVLLALSRRGYRRFLSLLPKQYRILLESLLKADIVVAAPGNYLYSSGRFGMALLLTLFSQKFVVAADRPLYLFPQTIGPLRYRWEYRFLGRILSAARLIFLREKVSATVLATLPGKPFRALIVPDMVFALERIPSEPGKALLSEYGVSVGEQPLLGVTVLDWGRLYRAFTRQAEYEEAIAQTIDFFVRAFNGQVVIFPQVRGPSESENDLYPSLRVYRRVQNHEQVFLVENIPSGRHLISAYGLMDLFLGTRLHSNLFALTQGVPVLAIAYQSKTYGIMEALGLKRWVIPIERVNAALLRARLIDLWAQRGAIHGHLTGTCERMHRQMQWIGNLVRRDQERLWRWGINH